MSILRRFKDTGGETVEREKLTRSVNPGTLLGGTREVVFRLPRETNALIENDE
jgi:hypothetical protein